MNTELRPETDEDIPFLLGVYGSTRADELAMAHWTDEQKQAFVRSQFGHQRTHYRRFYADASFDVILIDGRPAGRLYVHRQPASIHIIDIALLPEYRRQGVGRALIEALQREGERHRKVVSIHVEHFNPARRLYERLGFQAAGEPGPVYLYMEWKPDTLD